MLHNRFLLVGVATLFFHQFPLPSATRHMAGSSLAPSSSLPPRWEHVHPSAWLPQPAFPLWRQNGKNYKHTLKILFFPSSLSEIAGNTSLLSWILTPRTLKLVLLSELMADNFLFTATPPPPQELRACLWPHLPQKDTKHPPEIPLPPRALSTQVAIKFSACSQAPVRQKVTINLKICTIVWGSLDSNMGSTHHT